MSATQADEYTTKSHKHSSITASALVRRPKFENNSKLLILRFRASFVKISKQIENISDETRMGREEPPIVPIRQGGLMDLISIPHPTI
jgi:hypothetical protein